MESFLMKALQLIFSLSILVIIHELGHFVFARLFKVRVEKFYLFFNPWFSIFKFTPKNSETEYGLGWLPLGGYCKISGMIDESLDKEQMEQPPKPYEFRSKPAGPRLLIMTAGVIFNFLLALFIYSMMLFHWGDAYLPLKNVTYGMEFNDTFKEIGFVDGDILSKADMTPLERYEDCLIKIIEAKKVTVLRDGNEVVVDIPADMVQRVLRANESNPIYFRYPLIVNNVVSSTAKEAGLRENDHIICVNDVRTETFSEVSRELATYKGKTITIEVIRNGQPLTMHIPVDMEGRLGVQVANLFSIYETVSIRYNFFTSFPAGARLGVNTLKGYVGGLKHVFSKEGAKSLGGFGAIGNLFPATWNWRQFWELTAFLSIILAFMNILPIPALDGGHVLFLLYEVITRRKPSDKFLEYAQITGMILIITLILFANGNDIVRFFFK